MHTRTYTNRKCKKKWQQTCIPTQNSEREKVSNENNKLEPHYIYIENRCFIHLICLRLKARDYSQTSLWQAKLSNQYFTQFHIFLFDCKLNVHKQNPEVIISDRNIFYKEFCFPFLFPVFFFLSCLFYFFFVECSACADYCIQHISPYFIIVSVQVLSDHRSESVLWSP